MPIMLRIFVAILLSLSIASPGFVMASAEHHSQLHSAHAGDGTHQHHHGSSCDTDGCEVEAVLMCCAMTMGHCSSLGVPADAAGSRKSPVFGSADLSIDAAQLIKGQTFEADPPPPRA